MGSAAQRSALSKIARTKHAAAEVNCRAGAPPAGDKRWQAGALALQTCLSWRRLSGNFVRRNNPTPPAPRRVPRRIVPAKARAASRATVRSFPTRRNFARPVSPLAQERFLLALERLVLHRRRDLPPPFAQSRDDAGCGRPVPPASRANPRSARSARPPARKVANDHCQETRHQLCTAAEPWSSASVMRSSR